MTDDRARYRIGITRTDLLLPGSHDYYVIEYRNSRGQWFPLSHHPSRTMQYRGREIQETIMPFPLHQHREAAEAFCQIIEWENEYGS